MLRRDLRSRYLLRLFSAHEVRPAYLELRQTGTDTYDVLWKVPARGENMRLGIYVEFPSGTANVTTPRMSIANNASTERWSVKRTGGLTGGKIYIAGLAATMTDVLVRIENLDGTTQVTRLTPSSPSFVVAAAPGALEVSRTYLVLGVEHILFGIDHLLFVLALLILVKGWRKLVGTITAFTIAHSITLAAATLGFVHVPGKPVEATIALSIVFVAGEIVHRPPGTIRVNGNAGRGSWRLHSDFCTDSVSRARYAKSACRKTPSRSLFFSSTSAWNWGNSSSLAWSWR